MRMRFVSTLLSLGAVVAFLGTTPSTAYGCTWINGYCGNYAYYTGSEICKVLLKHIAKDIAHCDPTVDTCPVITCSAYGAVNADGTLCREGLPGYDNDGCLLSGIAICQNPQDKYNVNGTSYNLDYALHKASDHWNCDKKDKGKCSVTNEINPPKCAPEGDPNYDPNCDQSAGICNNNWTFVTFTAAKFKGEICACPGGYDKNDQCCATSDRVNGNQDCGIGTDNYYLGDDGLGTPACIQDFCSVDLSQYDFLAPVEDQLQYYCTAINHD